MSGELIEGSWTFQATNEIPATSGEQLASSTAVKTMAPAVVPGTPLTSMIKNGTYPDPFYGKIVTDTVPDTLKDTDYWYRTAFDVPEPAPGQRFWLRFDGISYSARIWLNGTSVGTIEGAFHRGIFDVTDLIAAGQGDHSPAGRTAYLAVRIGKLDFTDPPSLPSYASGVTRGRRNGGATGVTLKNGPSFFCTAGWDWLPTIPDRDMGIWQPASWFTTGAVRLEDVSVDTTLSDDLRSAEIRLTLTYHNASDTAVLATVSGSIDKTRIQHKSTVPPGTTSVTLTSADVAGLRLDAPRLWWPNGYGEPYLYTLQLAVQADGSLSDERELRFGVRRIEYVDADQQLRIKVNDLPILVMGGNWGLDEGLKRTPRERLRNQVRLHRDANLNLIRNWNGQSTTEDFFAACDEYGILVWQEFFFSSEGPAAGNIQRDIDNIRDCIINYRNHASILLWCGGNEKAPPPELVAALDQLVQELDPKRVSLTSSAGDTGANAIKGFSSGGPYQWETPSSEFSLARTRSTQSNPFRNEIGSYSIPTLEFIQAMLPESSWEKPDDYWADRDVNGNGGNGGGAGYIALTERRYGEVLNLPDFARKSQLMNYECIKAIYEAPSSMMLGPSSTSLPDPASGVIMWMSNPAQPSFVWQMYSHDLEAHSSFFAVQHGCRRLNVIMDASTRDLVLANHTAQRIGGKVTAEIFNLDGGLSSSTVVAVSGVDAASRKTIANLSSKIDAASTAVCFVRLTLSDAHAAVTAENFYWYDKSAGDSTYTDLDTMQPAVISVSASARDIDKEQTELTVIAKNTGSSVALMTHLQVFDKKTGERVLPVFYSDNYLNIVPGGTTQVKVVVPGMTRDLRKDLAIRIDGWKLDTAKSTVRGNGVQVVFNKNALATSPAQKTFGV
ncbi:glycoside hydrolase family 2 protein [Streptomyces sp. NBC_01497]|uniref:glycoside hydrolase family 2 protein n=1 Tax=Streptomyces sp. NBC_01497 TaxID=2903885 RepID=UPI002E35A2CD|nr:sugar-binding domain-containing protein [Streptomyces sp. NBC_01497]